MKSIALIVAAGMSAGTAFAWKVPNWTTIVTEPGAIQEQYGQTKKWCGHVQGMCVSSNAIYFSFHDQIVKTDWYGRLLNRTPTDPHGGDICLWDGKLYTGVWRVKKGERSYGAIYMYDAETLELLKTQKVKSKDAGVDGIVFNDPERMGELVFVHKLVLRLAGGGSGDDFSQFCVVLEGEENRLYVGILGANVHHAVVFLVLAGELVLFDDAVGVVVRMGAEDNAVLGAFAHGLGIHIVLFPVFPYQPAVFLPELEVLHGLVIGALLVFPGNGVEVNFGLGDVQEALFSGHGLGFGRIEDIVRRSRHFRYQVLGRPDGRKGFYSYHGYLFTWNLVLPVAKKSTIWRAAARPAFTLASAVWAPIFLGVANTRVPKCLVSSS